MAMPWRFVPSPELHTAHPVTTITTTVEYTRTSGPQPFEEQQP
jgi:hypothetical protein